ncbi:MAG: class I SAM-dependent methyltransferase [Pseudomonadota bacterium]
MHPAPENYQHEARRALLLQALPAVLAMQSAYHTGWVVLQLLGVISGLSSERSYIVRHLRALARARPIASVCIAGSADCGLLSLLHEAFGDGVRAMAVQVVDRSPVPLALCRQYAAHAGMEIVLEQRDLCEAPLRAGVADLVLTHSLLSFIAPQARLTLTRHLAARLGTGGRLLLYQSVRAGHGTGLLAFAPDEVKRMVALSLAAQREPERHLAILNEAALENIVRDFCAAKTTHAVASEQELVTSVKTSGLTAVRCERLFDQDANAHRPATPSSRYVKWVVHAQMPA